MHQAALALLTRYTTVQGYSALLGRVTGRDPLDVARVTHYTQMLTGEVGELGRFLEQYLQAVHLQAGLVTLHRRSVGLDEVVTTVQDSCARWPECTDRHTLVIDHSESVAGHWDPHWVIPALAAIVSNAMKFTPDGGTIDVQIRRRADAAVITVRDPGLGIRDDEREQIFLPFVRGSAAGGTTPGWGLGLYIAEQAVRAHGGRIELSSPPAGGTTAMIHLPLQPETVA